MSRASRPSRSSSVSSSSSPWWGSRWRYGRAERRHDMARVTGIGGIFFKSSNPASLRAWYRDTLGIKLESWGGAALPYDDPDHPPALIWSPFPQSTDYMAPSTKEFMI